MTFNINYTFMYEENCVKILRYWNWIETKWELEENFMCAENDHRMWSESCTVGSGRLNTNFGLAFDLKANGVDLINFSRWSALLLAVISPICAWPMRYIRDGWTLLYRFYRYYLDLIWVTSKKRPLPQMAVILLICIHK